MKIKGNLKIREIAGEKIVILEKSEQVDFTRVMVLNGTSEWLWNQLIGKEFDSEHVAVLLKSKYIVEESVALDNALTWIKTLKQYDVIEEK